MVCFRLKGEGNFGMPPTPLRLLGRFARCQCAGAARDTFVTPLDIEPAIITTVDPIGPTIHTLSPVDISALHSTDVLRLSAARSALTERLISCGWAILRVDDASASAMQHALVATAKCIRTLTDAQKDSWKHVFDGGRYVGYSRDSGREWVQLRDGATDTSRFAWPEAIEPQRETLCAGFRACDRVGRLVVRSVLGCLGSELDVDILMEGSRAVPFGGSVQRFLVYPCYDTSEAPPPAGNASNAHADMGLVTVAPPATIAALEMWDWRTGAVCWPERDLAPNEWLVFAGEALAFVTSGAIQAPIHCIRRVHGKTGEVRCAAPHFVRPHPQAQLVPLVDEARDADNEISWQ